MTSRCGVLFAYVAMLLGLAQVASARVEDAPSLKDRLHAAAAGSALDVAGVKPWYLKLDVSLFDESGKVKLQGTIEEWWAAPRLYKVQYDRAFTVGLRQGLLDNYKGWINEHYVPEVGLFWLRLGSYQLSRVQYGA